MPGDLKRDPIKDRTEEEWKHLFEWWRVSMNMEEYDLVLMVHRGIDSQEACRRQAKKCLAMHHGYGKTLCRCPY